MSPTWRRSSVAVVSDQSLIADVVAAALESNGFRCSVLPWPTAPEDGGLEQSVPLPLAAHLDIGLLISDFDRVPRIRSAVRLIVEVPACWVVLTGAPRGALWGALLKLGSAHVIAATTSLGEISEVLAEVADGAVLIAEEERMRLMSEWWQVLDEHQTVMARLATMTPRETQVLRLLYGGSPVREIAQELDVAEATVRTQVKRVLRKLDVRSQIAAVAAFEHIRRSEYAAGETDVVATTMWLGRQVPTGLPVIP